MKLSLNLFFAAKKIGYEKAINLSADAGFDALDMGFFDMKTGESPFCADNYKEVCDSLLSLAKSRGMCFNQAHAPFGSPYVKYFAESVPHFPRAFECCARLGVGTLVIHPVQDGQFYLHESEMLEKSVKFYKELIPMAREYGVRIATENMWQRDARGYVVDDTCASPEHFCAVVDSVDSEWLTACLDIGHIVLCGRDPYTFIHKLGRERLTALHIHDNDLTFDAHAAPFQGKIDWSGVCRALREIGYSGDFTYEVDRVLKSTPEAVYPSMLKHLERVGRYLISEIENI